MDPLVRWKAHSMEVVSIDYIPHETQGLVLSGGGDGTVRLWTMGGHYVGTFGQGRPWDLKSPATFQHPRLVIEHTTRPAHFCIKGCGQRSVQ